MATNGFDNITRRLDLNPASVDTTYAKSRSRGRIIQKIPYTFTIPAFSTTLASETGNRVGCLMGQINYTFPSAFRILRTAFDMTDLSNNVPLVTIRFRMSNSVYRYFLSFTNNTTVDQYAANLRCCQCPRYVNETIEPNFCIEFWCSLSSGFGANYSVAASTVTTNLLVNPASPDEIVEDVPLISNFTRANLGGAMPETLPKTYAYDSSWLTN